MSTNKSKKNKKGGSNIDTNFLLVILFGILIVFLLYRGHKDEPPKLAPPQLAPPQQISPSMAFSWEGE